MDHTFNAIALGCKVNTYENFSTEEIFRNHGYTLDEKNPEVIIINTCSVTSTADQKSRQIIRRERRNHPNAIIVTMGCYSQHAYEKIKEVACFMRDKLDVRYFYKKIDSTLRGNIAVEALGLLQILEMDAAIIIPAFPNENRVTVGGYHLSKGVPIEKTEIASDPHSPIYESHIPTILQKQIG